LKKSKKNESSQEKEVSQQLKKQLSPARAVARIIMGFFALLVWILIGVSPTVLFSSSIQEFIGVTSFFTEIQFFFYW
jgi:hypothetical protein